MIAIYKIENLINGKVYIGSSKDVYKRIDNHIMRLKGGYHINKHLQSSYNKYGKRGFKFEVIKEVGLGILRRAEQYYILKYDSLNPKKGYNKAVVISNKWDDSEDEIQIKNSIYFGCYLRNGKLFKVFRTIQDAYMFLGGRYTRIYESCSSNLTKTCKGYYWIRLDVSKDTFKSYIDVKSRLGRHRKIDQYTLNNEFIKTWDSAVMAAKILKLSSFNITRCLRSNNIYKGFKWLYSPIK